MNRPRSPVATPACYSGGVLQPGARPCPRPWGWSQLPHLLLLEPRQSPDAGGGVSPPAAPSPCNSGHWLLCLTLVFLEMGRSPLAFPDSGFWSVIVWPWTWMCPRKAAPLSLPPSPCWNMCASVGCVLTSSKDGRSCFRTGTFPHQFRFFCLFVLVFLFCNCWNSPRFSYVSKG